MAIDHYRDLSSGGDINAGFQFEFNCAGCGKRWRSPFKPYRMGQVTGLLTRFLFLVPSMRTAVRTGGNFAELGSRGAKEKALAEAMALAEQQFCTCPGCRNTVCKSCFDAAQDRCHACLAKAGQARAAQQRQQEAEAREASQHSCPNCRTRHDGGRFCAECGFDMASTHKSCPACAAMQLRSARFCTDCGHSF